MQKDTTQTRRFHSGGDQHFGKMWGHLRSYVAPIFKIGLGNFVYKELGEQCWTWQSVTCTLYNIFGILSTKFILKKSVTSAQLKEFMSVKADGIGSCENMCSPGHKNMFNFNRSIKL